MSKRENVPGHVYTLHLHAPFGHARHYTGFAEGGFCNVFKRLKTHGGSKGANMLRHAREAGHTWALASVRPGTRNDERALKRQGGAARRCPICKAEES